MCAVLTCSTSPPAGSPDAVRDLLLERGELDQVAVRLLAEVERVGVHDHLEGAVRCPGVDQADARHVGLVRGRLERGDRRVAGTRVRPEPVHEPGDLVAPGVGPVAKSGRVGVRVAQLRDPRCLPEVGPHPRQPGRVAVPGDDRIIRVGGRDGERQAWQLARRQGPPAGRHPGVKDAGRDPDPGLADRRGIDQGCAGCNGCRHARHGATAPDARSPAPRVSPRPMRCRAARLERTEGCPALRAVALGSVGLTQAPTRAHSTPHSRPSRRSARPRRYAGSKRRTTRRGRAIQPRARPRPGRNEGIHRPWPPSAHVQSSRPWITCTGIPTSARLAVGSKPHSARPDAASKPPGRRRRRTRGPWRARRTPPRRACSARSA